LRRPSVRWGLTPKGLQLLYASLDRTQLTETPNFSLDMGSPPLGCGTCDKRRLFAAQNASARVREISYASAQLRACLRRSKPKSTRGVFRNREGSSLVGCSTQPCAGLERLLRRGRTSQVRLARRASRMRVSRNEWRDRPLGRGTRGVRTRPNPFGINGLLNSKRLARKLLKRTRVRGDCR
jgi:hypothetical protein